MEITQEHVNNKLKSLGRKLLKPPYRNLWNEGNPTYGYCYIVTEAIYHYTNGEYIPQCINLGEGIGTHWYLKDKVTGEVVDFTVEQFNFYIDYSQGKGKGFMKGSILTTKGYISKRGHEMAKILKLVI